MLEPPNQHIRGTLRGARQAYVNQLKLRANTKTARYSAIKSFFAHNRVEFPRDPGYRITSERQPVRGTLTPQDVRQVVLSSNPAYQAVYLVMFQGALDMEMFLHWNTHGWDSLNKQLKSGVDPIKIDLPGRKKNRNIKNYYTFISTDARNAIENWLQHRPENAEAVITNQFGKPLTGSDVRNYWIRRLRKTGAISNVKGRRYVDRTGKNLHEVRDIFRSLWSLSPAKHWMAEYFMGHSIDKLEYDKSFRNIDEYKAEYAKAAPFLNIMSRGEAFGLVESNEINKLRQDQDNRVTELEAKLERMETLLMDALNNPEALAETKRRRARAS